MALNEIEEKLLDTLLESIFIAGQAHGFSYCMEKCELATTQSKQSYSNSLIAKADIKGRIKDMFLKEQKGENNDTKRE